MLIIPIFLSTTIYSFACLGLGGIAINIIRAEKSTNNISPIANIATRLLLGQGILANFWMLLALYGKFKPLLVTSIIGGLFVYGLLFNHRLLINAVNQVRNILNECLSARWEWKFFILATVIIWFAWFAAFGQSHSGDGTRFYLALPKVIAASEELKPLPGYEEVASLGLQGEMHIAALMTMGSPEANQVLRWLTLTAGCMMLLALSRLTGLKRHGQWLVLAMVFSSSAVIELSGSGKTDMFAMALAFASSYWAFNIQGDDRLQASILTGLFGGLAVLAKLSYVGSFLPSLALVLGWKLFIKSRELSLQEKFIPFAWVGLSAIFVIAPLPIKNQVLFENPMAPYGISILFDQEWYGLETMLSIYFKLPFSLTFGSYWAQLGNLSPLALMFSPLLFLLPKPRRMLDSKLAATGIAAAVGLACWFLYRPAAFAPRYFLGCLLLLTLPVSKAAEVFIEQGDRNRRFILSVSVVSILAMGLFYSTHIFRLKDTIHLLLSGEPNCKFDPVQCDITNTINVALPYGERMFANDSFRYWLRADLIQCALTTIEMETYLALERPALRWSYIVGRGFQSVLIYNRDTRLSNQVMEDLADVPDWLQVISVETSQSLTFLRINPKDDLHPSLYKCVQSNSPAWDVVELFTP